MLWVWQENVFPDVHLKALWVLSIEWRIVIRFRSTECRKMLRFFYIDITDKCIVG